MIELMSGVVTIALHDHVADVLHSEPKDGVRKRRDLSRPAHGRRVRRAENRCGDSGIAGHGPREIGDTGVLITRHGEDTGGHIGEWRDLRDGSLDPISPLLCLHCQKRISCRESPFRLGSLPRTLIGRPCPIPQWECSAYVLRRASEG